MTEEDILSMLPSQSLTPFDMKGYAKAIHKVQQKELEELKEVWKGFKEYPETTEKRILGEGKPMVGYFMWKATNNLAVKQGWDKERDE